MEMYSTETEDRERERERGELFVTWKEMFVYLHAAVLPSGMVPCCGLVVISGTYILSGQ
jgi:hypothetical protein